MSTIPREAIREFIKQGNFKTSEELLEGIKDLFRDALQEVMEGELDAVLGYDKQERRAAVEGSEEHRNYRNGHSKKTVKTQLGEVESPSRGIGTANTNHRFCRSIRAVQQGSKERYWPCTHRGCRQET